MVERMCTSKHACVFSRPSALCVCVCVCVGVCACAHARASERARAWGVNVCVCVACCVPAAASTKRTHNTTEEMLTGVANKQRRARAYANAHGGPIAHSHLLACECAKCVCVRVLACVRVRALLCEKKRLREVSTRACICSVHLMSIWPL
jgi:hypothetical protein